jgi:hypothetical protein
MYYPESESDNDYHYYNGGDSPVYLSGVSHSLEAARPQMAFDSDSVSVNRVSSAPGGGPGMPRSQVVQIRKEFPETWMFDTIEFNST